MSRRKRDPEEERRERDRFILLQHLYTLSQHDPGTLLAQRQLQAELAFTETEAAQLLATLQRHGFIRQDSAGLRVGATELCIRYLTREAARRRSVRLRS